MGGFNPEEISPHRPPCRHCENHRAHQGPRFVLGVDLDGVCADFFAGLRPIAAEWLGVPLESLTSSPTFGLAEWHVPEQPGGYDALHAFAVNRRNLFRELKPVPHAPQVLRRLSHKGVRIRIITHRFFISHSHERAASQTVIWLEEQDIPYSDLCLMHDKSAVDCDMYVDDQPRNVESVQKRFRAQTDPRASLRTAVLFDPTARAQQVQGALLASNWLQLEQLVMERFNEWTSARPKPPNGTGLDPISWTV